MNYEGLNRSSKKGFLTYMADNPVYFQQAFSMKPTKENIVKAYKQAMSMRKHNPFFPVGGRDFQRTYHARRPMAA